GDAPRHTLAHVAIDAVRVDREGDEALQRLPDRRRGMAFDPRELRDRLPLLEQLGVGTAFERREPCGPTCRGPRLRTRSSCPVRARAEDTEAAATDESSQTAQERGPARDPPFLRLGGEEVNRFEAHGFTCR